MATFSSAASSTNKASNVNLSNIYTSSATQSISTTPGPNVTWISPSISTGGGSSSNYGYLYSDLINTSNWTDASMKALLSCLPESKIEEIVDIVKMNSSDEEMFKTIIRSIVSCRHFSEDFLLKYIDYLTKDILYTKHRENICSREYHSLALLLEERDKE